MPQPVGKAFNDAGQAIKKVGEDIVDGVKKVGKTISDALAISPEVNVDIPVDITPGDKVDSPWGEAVSLFKKEAGSDNGVVKGELALYCVKCGVTGKVHLGGQARWTIAEGLTKANVDMKGEYNSNLAPFFGQKVDLRRHDFTVNQRKGSGNLENFISLSSNSQSGMTSLD